MNTEYRWYKSHVAYIDAEVNDLEAYLNEDTDLLPEDVEDAIGQTRRKIEIHLEAFYKEGILDNRKAETLQKYAEGRLMVARANWELENR